ncbi:Vi polysaccharide biosynthesis protein VipB/TviC [Methyloceanibacter superfactus]|uniref:Vi polysaccharide biosynthesis protein VipB/TviC n=1 Tax=Methyloceanibacter superfactus TaxID=1774969 RepID=A0A1E3VVU4_9HYPH|nr:SDR family oxidoreductase [Methyloceanibacter superfactus]ODR97411.1 Vi polysaccharide biosynthesis protein VipB/TviC [Methyloceanibacter superfactus]
MTLYDAACDGLARSPKRFLVTGAAGFIGSNLVEALLRLGQSVVGLDNFATGHRHNVEMALADCGDASAQDRLTFVNADIRDADACLEACKDIEVVLHHAAIGSVPYSLADPLTSHICNVDGFLNMLLAAKQTDVRRFVYASSSAVYGDDENLPKLEESIGRPLSPYALTKVINEQYADLFARIQGMDVVGLRYFNVFGKRQDPNGPYAAVIPRWIAALLRGKPIEIYGDGETTRDWCYVENVVQMNILASTTPDSDALNAVYNVGAGSRTTLNELYEMIVASLRAQMPLDDPGPPAYCAFREGDIRDSLADISRARILLGYEAKFDLAMGLEDSIGWYCAHMRGGD